MEGTLSGRHRAVAGPVPEDHGFVALQGLEWFSQNPAATSAVRQTEAQRRKRLGQGQEDDVRLPTEQDALGSGQLPALGE